MTAEARTPMAQPPVRKKKDLLLAVLGFLTLFPPAFAQNPQPAPAQTLPAAPLTTAAEGAGPARPRPRTGPWPGQGDPAVEKVRRCILARESGGDYSVADPTRRWFGGYQFQLRISDLAARRMRRPELIGLPASEWSPLDQDAAFYLIYDRGRGRRHWAGGRYPCP